MEKTGFSFSSSQDSQFLCSQISELEGKKDNPYSSFIKTNQKDTKS